MIRKLMFRLLSFVDTLTIRKYGFKTLEGSKSQCIYVHYQTYLGEDKVLKDGTVIKKGDPVAEIHLNNKVMASFEEIKMKALLRIFKEELKLCAQSIEEGKIDVVAIYGRTQLYPVFMRLGFEVYDVGSPVLNVFLSIWDSIYKWTFTAKKGQRFKTRPVKELWMSKAVIINKAGKTIIEKEMD